MGSDDSDCSAECPGALDSSDENPSVGTGLDSAVDTSVDDSDAFKDDGDGIDAPAEGVVLPVEGDGVVVPAEDNGAVTP